MNVYVWVLGVALALAAAANWMAVVRGQRDIETLAKPSFMVLLIALAWLMRADSVSYGQFLLAGLALSLIGDVFLLGDTDVHFLGGLAAFLLGHLAYIAAFRRVPGGAPSWVGVILVVLVVAVVVWWRLLPMAREDWRAAAPLIGYAVVLGAMAALAWATGLWLVGLGGTLFLLSDALLAYQRFEGSLPNGRVAVMVTYHLAQVLITVGLLRC